MTKPRRPRARSTDKPKFPSDPPQKPPDSQLSMGDGLLLLGIVIFLIAVGFGLSRATKSAGPAGPDWTTLTPPPTVIFSVPESDPVAAVPLSDWIAVYGIKLPPKIAIAPVRVRARTLPGTMIGRYQDQEEIVELDPGLIPNLEDHAGVLAHEIAHRYCGLHDGRSEIWARCAQTLGVPARYQHESLSDDIVLNRVIVGSSR